MSTPVGAVEKFTVRVNYEIIAPKGRFSADPGISDRIQLNRLMHASLSNLHVGSYVGSPVVTLVKLGEL